MSAQHQHSSTSDDGRQPGVSPEVREFIRAKGLLEDFTNYRKLLERNFPDYGNIAFRVSPDPEIDNLIMLEATMDVKIEFDAFMDAYDHHLRDFHKTISHDNQEYFTLSFNFIESG